MRTVRKVSSHRHRKRHGLPFNFLSGFIYTGAVILSIALGAMFYKGVKSADVDAAGRTADHVEASDLPPGARVVIKQEQPEPPPARPRPARKPAPAAQSDEPSTAPPTPTETPAAPPEDDAAPDDAQTGEAPEPRALPRTPWEPFGLNLPQPHTITIVPSADTTIFAAPAQLRASNLGGHDELILKGHESFALTRFDIAPLSGWTIRRAAWRAKVKRGLLREIGFSTITADWTEGTGTMEKKTASGATFVSADFGGSPADGQASSILQVLYGNGNSLFCVGAPDLQVEQSNEWITVEIDPLLVQALVADAAYGIAIFDVKGQISSTPAGVFSRETTESHYFEVEGQLVDIEPPGEINDLAAHEHPSLSGHQSVGALLTWTAPGDDGAEGQAFKYDVRYGSAAGTFDKALAVPRSRIPYPQPAGRRDQMVIEGLDPNTRYAFFIRAVDEAGQPGPVATVAFTTPARFSPPAARTSEPFNPQTIGILNHALTFEICDEHTGVDPVSGTHFGSLDPAGANKAPTFIWDRDARAVHLRAVQNENLAFTIVIGKNGKDFPALRFSADPFQSTGGEIPARDMAFYRVDYHYAGGRGPSAWRGDALVPVDGFLMVPAESQKRMGQQMFQSVYAELLIPAAANPGLYRSKLTVETAEGESDSVNLFLTVLPIRLPDRPRFTVELLGRAGFAALYRKSPLNTVESLPVEREYHRLAQRHRCTLAYLPYSSGGECPQPFSPPVTGEGLDARITSWGPWDERFGPYLDGSAFAGLPGSKQSAPHVILPLFENWPSVLNAWYGCADWDVVSPRARVAVFGGPSDQLRQCLDHDYWRAFRTAAQQFADHFAEKGWAAKGHIWLCNTPTDQYKGRPPPWSLGQPEFRDDYEALQAYAEILAAGADAGGLRERILFRVHVPNSLLLQEYGAGLFDLLSVSDPTAAGWRRLRERAAIHDETLWWLSESVPLEPTTLPVAAEAVTYFLEGADGWTIRGVLGSPGDWARANPQSLFYHGAALKSEGPLPSLRLKALRRVQQDIDLLILLQRDKGWSRQQLAEFARQYIPDRPGSYVSSVADWHQLRYAAQELLGR
ncbi:MAG: fibronectin type III domain-containing protein [Kiritimatiellae bacterium]|nr:fibronectin type III domain-containing protein [Kiritimatiellia bacterium]